MTLATQQVNQDQNDENMAKKPKYKNKSISTNYNQSERDNTNVSNVQKNKEPIKPSGIISSAWKDSRYTQNSDQLEERAMEDKYLEKIAASKAAAIEYKKGEKRLDQRLKEDSAKYANTMKKIHAEVDIPSVKELKKQIIKGSYLDYYLRKK